MKNVEKKAILGGILVIAVVLVVVFGRVYFDGRKDRLAQEVKMEEEQENNDNKAELPRITSQELEVILKDNADDVHIIDIRSQRAFDTKHLPNTINVPQDALELRDIFLPAESIVVLIDDEEESFSNNPLLQEIVDAPQEKRVVYLDGGFGAWDTETGRTISYGDPDSFVDHAKVSPISKEEVQNKLSRDPGLYTIVDVRSNRDYAKGHIDGAINVPLEMIEERAASLPIGTIVIVYGRNELEGFQAGVRLHDLGYLSVQMLQGGYENWINPPEESPAEESATTPQQENATDAGAQ